MSADNGVYVLLTETEKGPEYRVAYANAIDNIYGKYNNDLGRYEGDVKCIKSTFAEAPIFHSLNEALDHAEELENDYEYLEDGVCVITDFKDLSHIFE
jgi:hypothetical protein